MKANIRLTEEYYESDYHQQYLTILSVYHMIFHAMHI